MSDQPFQPSAAHILDHLPSALVYAENDEHYTLRYANAEAARLLGYDPDEFLHNRKYRAASAVHPDDLDLLEELDERQARTKKTMIVRYRLVDANGDPVPVLDVSRPDFDATGALRGFVTLLIDLREAPELQGPSALLSRLV